MMGDEDLARLRDNLLQRVDRSSTWLFVRNNEDLLSTYGEAAGHTEAPRISSPGLWWSTFRWPCCQTKSLEYCRKGEDLFRIVCKSGQSSGRA